MVIEESPRCYVSPLLSFYRNLHGGISSSQYLQQREIRVGFHKAREDLALFLGPLPLNVGPACLEVLPNRRRRRPAEAEDLMFGGFTGRERSMAQKGQ